MISMNRLVILLAFLCLTLFVVSFNSTSIKYVQGTPGPVGIPGQNSIRINPSLCNGIDPATLASVCTLYDLQAGASVTAFQGAASDPTGLYLVLVEDPTRSQTATTFMWNNGQRFYGGTTEGLLNILPGAYDFSIISVKNTSSAIIQVNIYVQKVT